MCANSNVRLQQTYVDKLNWGDVTEKLDSISLPFLRTDSPQPLLTVASETLSAILGWTPQAVNVKKIYLRMKSTEEAAALLKTLYIVTLSPRICCESF